MISVENLSIVSGAFRLNDVTFRVAEGGRSGQDWRSGHHPLAACGSWDRLRAAGPCFVSNDDGSSASGVCIEASRLGAG